MSVRQISLISLCIPDNFCVPLVMYSVCMICSYFNIFFMVEAFVSSNRLPPHLTIKQQKSANIKSRGGLIYQTKYRYCPISSKISMVMFSHSDYFLKFELFHNVDQALEYLTSQSSNQQPFWVVTKDPAQEEDWKYSNPHLRWTTYRPPPVRPLHRPRPPTHRLPHRNSPRRLWLPGQAPAFQRF